MDTAQYVFLALQAVNCVDKNVSSKSLRGTMTDVATMEFLIYSSKALGSKNRGWHKKKG